MDKSTYLLATKSLWQNSQRMAEAMLYAARCYGAAKARVVDAKKHPTSDWGEGSRYAQLEWTKSIVRYNWSYYDESFRRELCFRILDGWRREREVLGELRFRINSVIEAHKP